MATLADRFYKVVNTVDQNCLLIDKGSYNGSVVTVNPFGGWANQCWKPVYNAPTKNLFVVDNQPTPNVTYVLDASQTAAGEVCVYGSRASPNQLWTCDPIKPNSFLFFIINASDNRVLQYDGSAQKVHVVPKDPSNPKQYWVMQE